MNWDRNKSNYDLAIEGLTLEERKAFDNYLFGALTVNCPHEDYFHALVSATSCLKKFRNNKETPECQRT